ncbi:hypothetical protein J6I90_03030 [Pseudidiomarina sp. 1APP75-32.1]|uniref:DUF1471 domain-containing protein n=1 Tax=Pseudidiomarina terrestris TaxID=2820060 RepID=A0AAW7QZW5_9GAMM|nr:MULTISPECIES: hypothetical protein [unclassified Pseudidiomarina]MDN7123844.1 hypothetical protein [Pseudidiomarina sp. 1APP75-32.1]MEA3588721.1 hypothetical protein [Pseudidiomarina sp. 1APP75-27a]
MKKLVLSLALVASTMTAPVWAKQPTLNEALSHSLAAQTQMVKQQLANETRRSSFENLAEMRKDIPYRVVVYASLATDKQNQNDNQVRVQPE